MQSKRDGLVKIGEVVSGLDGPVKEIRESSPQAGVTSRNGKNRTLSHQKQLASALNRRVCEVLVPTLTTPFGVRGFPLPPG